MPRTYTENTGIIKPGDGEESGVWGDIVNDNMDILDRAINGVLSLSLSGTTTTLTTGSGSTSGTSTYGQYRVLVLGGSPSGTNTITVAPNDAQKLYFVVNNSGESVVFTQGSGGDVTIADGGSAIIYCDGGGSAAAVVDVSALFVPNLGNAGVTASVSELNILDGVTASTAELNILDGVTADASEINLLDSAVSGTVANGKAVVYGAAGEVNATTLQVGGSSITATPAELNILDGVTASTAELNILDGVTASTAELNILDGVTANAGQINQLNGNNFSTMGVTGAVSASGNITANTSNTTGLGFVLSDDGDIVDLNDFYCSIRFTNGVRIYSASRGGTPVITLGSNGVISGSLASAVGYNQTWQFVSRAVGISYQNTTGKPIMVAVFRPDSVYLQVSTDNSSWVTIANGGGGSGEWGSGSMIVPNGHYYRVTGGTLHSWAELC
jgi:hypothetical protein